jgi:deferrochelatase/peroxidase EfeB
MADSPGDSGTGFSRRSFLFGAAAAGGVAVAAGATAWATDAVTVGTDGLVLHPPVDFTGTHQAGIATEQQDRLFFAAFDLTTTGSPAARRAAVQAMLTRWTQAAHAMTQGQVVPGLNEDPTAPPADTGEAVGLAPARLTITIGFGPSFFDKRLGLQAQRPAALKPLPPMPGDELDPARSDGDICIQACSDDPQVAFHAIRNLTRLGRGDVVMRWSQLGFGRTSQTTSDQETLRNLMGFKDGTRNIRSGDTPVMDQWVWVGDETDQPWMKGGSYLVTRRIRMLIESWDRDDLGDQQDVMGRFKYNGAPLSGGNESTDPNYAATNPAGELVIPVDAHIRLASPENNDGVKILRRGYSFTDGTDPVTGQLDAGLFFIAYMKNPAGQFVRLQNRLGASDALNEYIKHASSAVFACPPGLAPGQLWGQTILT